MRILYVTTIGLTMCFFPEHIKMLLEEGHTVDIACNDSESAIPDVYKTLGLKSFTVAFSRNPFDKSNIEAYKQIKKIVEENKYDIVHTHTPNASVIVRLACKSLRKKGLKVFYTAHGFHFYKGAPVLNWLLYYPVEKFCSRFTDTLITINDEDFECAKNRFHAKKTEKIPGIGVDLKRLESADTDRDNIRKEFGIPSDAKVLIYVAELNKNKNQSSLIDMMAETAKVRQDVMLMLVGSGNMRDELEAKAKAMGISDKIIFTGFRSDISQLLRSADVCVPSSIREGFGLNVVEAMSCGIPVVAYDNRGHRTIINNGKNGYIVPGGNYTEMSKQVLYLLDNPQRVKEICEEAYKTANNFSVECSVDVMKRIYEDN